MLTTSELAELTQRINARVVRVIHEEIAAWQREQVGGTLTEEQLDDFLVTSGAIDKLIAQTADALPSEDWEAELDAIDPYEPDFEGDDGEPKYKTSEARRLRLADAKRQERRRKVEYERKAEVMTVIKVQPTLHEIVAFVQQHAMAGMMPSKATFDNVRPKHWATSSEQTRRLGMAWSEIATEAGLRVRPSRHMQEA